jgi:hypothetical protein
MRTAPVKYSAGPLPDGCEPFRLISIGRSPFVGSRSARPPVAHVVARGMADRRAFAGAERAADSAAGRRAAREDRRHGDECDRDGRTEHGEPHAADLALAPRRDYSL